MNRIRERIQDKRGFTLGETLAAVMIMLLASAVVAAGIPAAANAYNNAVDAANAQVLLSTAVSALRDELSTAWDVEIIDETTVSYKSSDTGYKSKIYLDSNVIMLQEYEGWETDAAWLDSDSSVNQPGARPLLSEASRRRVKGSVEDPNSLMKVTYSGIDWSGDSILFSGLKVQRNGEDIAIMPDGAMEIRVLTKKVTP